jgi:predicted alpha/beta superfamily hydrolase
MINLHRTRTLRLYLPPSYAAHKERRYPVIYMHDGQNLFDQVTAYAGEWCVDESMNALARHYGFEAIVVGIDNSGSVRAQELIPWPDPRLPVSEGAAYVAFVMDTVKPWIDEHYRTQPDRAHTAMIGSSLGGFITHYAMTHHPDAIGKVGIFSPSYFVSARIFEETEAHPWPAGTRAYLYIGGREHLDGDPGEVENVPDVERMAAVLRNQVPRLEKLRVRIDPLGHHGEAAWRAEFPRAVAWLFNLSDADVGSVGMANACR